MKQVIRGLGWLKSKLGATSTRFFCSGAFLGPVPQLLPNLLHLYPLQHLGKMLHLCHSFILLADIARIVLFWLSSLGNLFLPWVFAFTQSETRKHGVPPPPAHPSFARVLFLLLLNPTFHFFWSSWLWEVEDACFVLVVATCRFLQSAEPVCSCRQACATSIFLTLPSWRTQPTS
jgi:hypothetical protein